MFDTVCKFLAETFAPDFATWLLGGPIALSELSPSELSLEPIRADALILLKSAETILHLEFQVSPDPTMAFRMADYRLRVYRRFPHKEMRQVVIYLQPTQSRAVHQTRFEISGLSHEFEVIRLWEQSPSNFLTRPGLLPFAVLTQTADRPELLRQVATQIEGIPERWTQSHIAASTAILAGLLLEQGLIRQVLRRELMQESVIYQEIKAEGRQEGWQEGLREGKQAGLQEGRQTGLQEGKQAGLQEGRQIGLQEGRRQEGVALIQRQLARRLGALSDEVQAQLAVLSLVQIEALGEALLDFVELANLETWLRQLQVKSIEVVQQLTQKFGELEEAIALQIKALSSPQLIILQEVAVDFRAIGEVVDWLKEQNDEDFE
ncbi:MAG: Rpn family recombination-promoting nuclease/putative transposase [Cyanothece sp. SIO1E1]|nr:Rpn family recombination-promoting nuclease/putative transposase [Cyanothece sp. SIO1E1]